MTCTSFLGSQPGLQLLAADSTNTGTSLRVTAALAFLFLLGLDGLGQVVAILLSQNAAGLSILPEEAPAAGLRLVIVVSDPIDQNDPASCSFSHRDILHCFAAPPGKSGNDKSPVMRIGHHEAM